MNGEVKEHRLRWGNLLMLVTLMTAVSPRLSPMERSTNIIFSISLSLNANLIVISLIKCLSLRVTDRKHSQKIN